MNILNRYPFSPLSSVHGKIEEVLFVSTYDPAVPDEALNRFREMFDKFDHSVKLLFLARYLHRAGASLTDKSRLAENFETSFKDQVAQAKMNRGSLAFFLQQEDYYAALGRFWLNRLGKLSKSGEKFDYEETFLKGWAQDPFVVLESSYGVSALLEPMFSDRRWAETFVGDQIAAKWGMTLRSTKYNLEGGNILADFGFVFLGADTLFRNIHFYAHFGETCANITNNLQKAFGNHKVCWVGLKEEQFGEIDELARKISSEPWEIAQKKFQEQFYWQPFFHIDLYLTLGGWKNGKYLVFLGEPSAGEINGFNLNTNPVLKRLYAFQATRNWLYYIGERLNIHFEVVPMPMVLQVLSEKDSTPYFRCFNFNNVLVEIHRGCRRIYFPNTTRHIDHWEYQRVNKPDPEPDRGLIDSVAKKAREIYHLNGFQVIDVNLDYRANSKEKSGIHCLFKVLRRTPN